MDSISPSPRSRLISPPARRIVRLAALLLGVATFAAACTSSSSADSTPDVVESSPSTQADAPEVTLPSTTEAAGDLAPVPLPERKIVSDGGAILEITEARRLTIARTGALEIGQDPSEADKFGRFDLGAGRSVIAIVHHGDDTESVLFVDNDASVRLAGGVDAIAADDASYLAWVGPSGDEVHIGDLTGAITETISLDAPAVDMAETSTGFVVLSVTSSSSTATQVAMNEGRSTGSKEIPMSAGTSTITAVTDGQIAGVAIRGDRSVVDVIALDGSVAGSAVLEGHIRELDFSSDGAVAIAINEHGDQLWWSDGRSDLIDDEPVRAAQW